MEDIAEDSGKELTQDPSDKTKGERETLHLLASSTNAERLFDALEEANRGEIPPCTIENLKRGLGLDWPALIKLSEIYPPQD